MSNLAGLYEGIDMAKVMMGQNAFQIPLNIISQECGDGEKVAGVFQTSQGLPLRFGSKRTHVMMLGDLIFRPRVVIASDAFRGQGISGLFRDGFVDMAAWITSGDLLLSPDPAEMKAAHERIGRGG